MNALQAAAEHQTDSDETGLRSLLGRIALGDGQALGSFYDQTLSQVYGLILRVVRNPADAEEVIGDLYLQVWERAGDFQPGRGAVAAWLKTMAWSRAVDRQRRGRKFGREVELHPEAVEAAYTQCEDDSTEAAAAASSSAKAVQRAFSVLSDVQQRILTLAFQHDMSHQEIAAQTGIPLGTVKSHARRGMAAMREALGGEGSANV